MNKSKTSFKIIVYLFIIIASTGELSASENAFKNPHIKKKIKQKSAICFSSVGFTLSFSNIMYPIFDVTDGCGEAEILAGDRAGCTFCIFYQKLMPLQQLFSKKFSRNALAHDYFSKPE